VTEFLGQVILSSVSVLNGQLLALSQLAGYGSTSYLSGHAWMTSTSLFSLEYGMCTCWRQKVHFQRNYLILQAPRDNDVFLLDAS